MRTVFGPSRCSRVVPAPHFENPRPCRCLLPPDRPPNSIGGFSKANAPAIASRALRHNAPIRYYRPVIPEQRLVNCQRRTRTRARRGKEGGRQTEGAGGRIASRDEPAQCESICRRRRRCSPRRMGALFEDRTWSVETGSASFFFNFNSPLSPPPPSSSPLTHNASRIGLPERTAVRDEKKEKRRSGQSHFCG